MVSTEQYGDIDYITITIRADSLSDNQEGIGYQRLRFTMSDESVITPEPYPVDRVRVSGDQGRAAVVVPYDYNRWTLAPGYEGPNAQTGWGNIVTGNPGEGGTVPAGRFIIQTWNGQPESTLDANFFWQFVKVNSDGSAVRLGEPTFGQGADNEWRMAGAGTTLKALTGQENVTFDEPGYYKLMVWPVGASTTLEDDSLEAATQSGDAFINFDPRGFGEPQPDPNCSTPADANVNASASAAADSDANAAAVAAAMADAETQASAAADADA
ncbi:hypothetical protein M0722_17800, partial [Microbacterium sp. KSW4-16]|uniref:hypothetical protein n=1 Tax=Microbacterium aurugineum TaxID=2851642 RepID=UPI0020BD4C59